uniref:Uncharacterized protein n=1 Tax=Rhizophora mucronata TaxID=61149 RepID=A0A2P2ME13_RHIMU
MDLLAQTQKKCRLDRPYYHWIQVALLVLLSKQLDPSRMSLQVFLSGPVRKMERQFLPEDFGVGSHQPEKYSFGCQLQLHNYFALDHWKKRNLLVGKPVLKQHLFAY